MQLADRAHRYAVTCGLSMSQLLAAALQAYLDERLRDPQRVPMAREVGWVKCCAGPRRRLRRGRH